MINLLIALFLAKGLKKQKGNSEFKFLGRIFKDLFESSRNIFRFTSKTVKSVTNKQICQATVAPMKNIKAFDLSEYTFTDTNNIINFKDYKRKEANHIKKVI